MATLYRVVLSPIGRYRAHVGMVLCGHPLPGCVPPIGRHRAHVGGQEKQTRWEMAAQL